jgi:serine O-acetyltransferase
MDYEKRDESVCRVNVETLSQYRQRLPEVTEKIIASCRDKSGFSHIDFEPVHSNRHVAELVTRFREILFPGYFCTEKLDPVNLTYNTGQNVSRLFDMLSAQIVHVLRHDCLRYDQACIECENSGYQMALEVLEEIPAIRKVLATDVRAAFEGDPAAKSYDEIIFSYPGLFAISVYRVAHRLFELGVPLLPRIMTEYAHSLTGIDIHPGAKIGEGFVIDHGTGVVIGESTQIGADVRIYQGVTLGALSLNKAAVGRLRGAKRHPTIEDDVIIYSGATILGGDTVIGARSIIGGNVWITESVPPDTKVLMKEPELVYM